MRIPSARRAAVAAPNAAAASAAQDVIALGGTAVDAAIAALAVTYVTEPGIVSALGSAFVNVWPADGSPVVVDGNCEMPGRGLPRSRFGGGLREVQLAYGGGISINAGAGSAATPGAFAAFEVALEAFGRAALADILAPAIAVARRGFRVGQATGSYLQLAGELYGFDPHTRAQHFADDAPVGPGAELTNPVLADALETVAQQGISSLYVGDLARAIASQVHDDGGLITEADLAAYQAVMRPASRAQVGQWDVALNPPPSIGGPVLTTMLRLLGAVEPSAEHVIAIQHRAISLRASQLDLAEDLLVAGQELLAALDANELDSLPTSQDTAHVSVVDSDGMACAITSSAGYSSGVTIPGTGLILNNCLGEPELNRRGLHALTPGTRLASNMAPTTARRADGAVLAIGSPGADRITTALMQVLARYFLGGASLAEAIEAPRLHVHLSDGAAIVDFERDPQLAAAITRSGLESVEHEALAMYFGGVGAAYRDANGTLSAAGDPRRAAAIAVTKP